MMNRFHPQLVAALALFLLPNLAKSQDPAKPAEGAQTPTSRREPRVPPEPPPVSEEEKALRTNFKTVPIAAIKDIVVDNRGGIEFTAEGTTYIIWAVDEGPRLQGALALLEEMRKAKEILFLSRAFDRPIDGDNPELKGKRNIFRFKLVFETLKPVPAAPVSPAMTTIPKP